MLNSIFYVSLPHYLLTTITFITITMEGTVKFFNEAKGFGFVKEQGTEKEYFVHVSGLVDKIRENDKITFELKEGKKGLNAVNVRVAG
jgi:CspA family cold shock protein